MDKNHRDRIAFLRICSGKFEKGMSVTHVQRNKKIKLSQPQQFVAQDRVIIDSAYPGDIIGIHDPGIFNIGDTLTGKFEKGMSVTHVQRNKKIKLSQPQQFVAQDRVIIDSAYPGDIIGIHDPGIFNIGDTLSEKQSNLQYTGIPQFAPEHFARISTKNALKRKQFVKGEYLILGIH